MQSEQTTVPMSDFDRWFIDLRVAIVCSLLNESKRPISEVVSYLKAKQFKGAYHGSMSRLVWLCCLEMKEWGWLDIREAQVRRSDLIAQRVVSLSRNFTGLE